jgi:hypothetical protein
MSMADITAELAAIQRAARGEEVRDSIVAALRKLNENVDGVFDGDVTVSGTVEANEAGQDTCVPTLGQVKALLADLEARIPASGTVDDDGRIQFFNAAGEQIFYIQLPVYEGEVFDGAVFDGEVT